MKEDGELRGDRAAERRRTVHQFLSAVEFVVVAVPATYLSLPAIDLALNAPAIARALAADSSDVAWVAAPVLGLWAMPVLWGVLLERVIFVHDAPGRAPLLLRLYILTAVVAGATAALLVLSVPLGGSFATWVAAACLLTGLHQAPFVRRRFFDAPRSAPRAANGAT